MDIPLREPLDPEYRLNRKLAKQIYNKEKEEKVHRHKEELQLAGQQILDAKKKKEAKILKKQEKEKKDEYKMRLMKIEEKETKR